MSDEKAAYLATAIGQIDLFLLAVAAIWAFLLFRRGARRPLWWVIGIACVVLGGTDVYAFVRRPESELSALVIFWGFVEMPVLFALLVALPSLGMVTAVMTAKRFLRLRSAGGRAG